MRPLSFGSALAAIVIISCPVQAKEPKSADDKRICKISEQTGSRLAKHKVCMTRKEWKLEEAEQARELRDVQDGGMKTTSDLPKSAIPR